jgi:hypothetical protein
MLRSGRIALVAVTLLVLVFGASAFVTASSNAPAGAACSGSSPFVISTFDGSGTLVAQESVTYPGTTCNGDSYYSGAVLDAYTDGSCATAYYLEPLAYYAAQGTSCTTGGWSVYSYVDTINTNSVFVSVRPSYLSDNWVTSSGY